MAKDQNQDIDLGIMRFEYGDPTREQRAVLTIETGKHYSGGVSSTASVFWVGSNMRSQCIGLYGADGGDFSKAMHINRNAKATQKAIDTQHNLVFTVEIIAGLIKAAKDHYAPVVEKGEDGFHNTYPQAVTA